MLATRSIMSSNSIMIVIHILLLLVLVLLLLKIRSSSNSINTIVARISSLTHSMFCVAVILPIARHKSARS